MKKILLSIFGLMSLTAVHAQQTVVIERPGIFTDLASAATALVTLPVAAAAGFVEGTVEAVCDVVTGSTTVIATPAPVVVQPRVVVPAPVVVQPRVAAPAPVVVAPPVVTPAPVIVAPPIVSPECSRTPHVSTTTITTQTVSPSGIVTVQSYTRPISAYETGVPIAPVPVEHRVGTSPHVNPYVFRYR